MTNKPDIQIAFTADFKRDVARLYRRFRNIQHDVDTFIQLLRDENLPGDKVRGVGYDVYKARICSRDMKKGKSGGYRALYYVRRADRIVLVTLYAKSDQSDISPNLLKQIIDEFRLSAEDDE